jgi:hypothetical protein
MYNKQDQSIHKLTIKPYNKIVPHIKFFGDEEK